jgi:hypothetical protein
MVSKKTIITSVAAALLAIGMATAPAMARGGGGGHMGGGFGGGVHGGGFGGGFHGGGFHGGFAGRGYGGHYVRGYGFGDYSGDGCYTHPYIHRYYCS